jgi:hypothetical protein
MAKSGKPKGRITPELGTSAKLADYLSAASTSAKPPKSSGTSTGGPPTNRKKSTRFLPSLGLRSRPLYRVSRPVHFSCSDLAAV